MKFLKTITPQRLVIVALAFVLGNALFSPLVFAANQPPYSESEIRALGIYFVAGKWEIGNDGDSSGRSSECTGNGQLPTGPGATVDGHTLPAGKGGTGLEEKAVKQGNKAVLERNGAPLALNPSNMTDTDVRFYIAMRWRYVLWKWDGSSTANGAKESYNWYNQQVRKVKVTNPANGKSVIAAILESGPGPWAGTKRSVNNPPDYWQGYVDGTPEGYDGRVAGLAPEAFDAIKDPPGPYTQWENGGEKGVALTYEWADQSLQSGTTNNGPPSATPDSGGTRDCLEENTVPNGEFVFYNQYDPRWKDHPYGSSTVSKSGCGPSAVAMVVATMKDKGVTPKEVADFGTRNNMYVEGAGSSWALMTKGPENWGLKSKDLGLDIEAAKQTIRSGGYVIATGQGSSPFTSGGHILVLRAISSDGKNFKVGDSGHTDTNDKEYSEDHIMQSAKNLWAITK